MSPIALLYMNATRLLSIATADCGSRINIKLSDRKSEMLSSKSEHS